MQTNRKNVMLGAAAGVGLAALVGILMAPRSILFQTLNLRTRRERERFRAG